MEEMKNLARKNLAILCVVMGLLLLIALFTETKGQLLMNFVINKPVIIDLGLLTQDNPEMVINTLVIEDHPNGPPSGIRIQEVRFYGEDEVGLILWTEETQNIYIKAILTYSSYVLMDVTIYFLREGEDEPRPGDDSVRLMKINDTWIRNVTLGRVDTLPSFSFQKDRI